MTVYLVEDSVAVRDRLWEECERMGVCLVGCSDQACESIRQIRQLKPDTVVLDLGLAQGSGFAVLRALQEEPEAPVFIVFSNNVDKRVRAACQRAGAHYVFDKSEEIEEMFGTLRTLSRQEAQ